MKDIQDFKVWLTILGYSSSCLKKYPREAQKMLEGTGLDYRHIKREELDSYVQQLKNHQPPFRPSYINSHISAIRIFGKFLQNTKNYHLPTSHLMYCKMEQKQPEFLTVEEIKMLYAVTDDSKYGLRDKAMLSVCYGAGLRRNEAISLHVKDIDTKHGNIHVRAGKNYKERLVPIPKRAVEDIKIYLKESRPMFQKDKYYQRELFLGYRGTAITSQVYEKRIKVLARMTGDINLIQKNITLHLLRHSIATHLMQAGVPLEQVSKFLGHGSLSSTQVYTHIKSYNHEQKNIPDVFTG